MTEAELIRYLLATGLLTPRSIVDGSLRVINAGGRNSSFRVTTMDGPAYLIKQGYDGHEAVQREAAAYAFLSSHTTMNEVREILPNVVPHDREDSLLVLQYIHGVDLRQYHERVGRCPISLAARAAELLAMLHTLPTTGIPPTLRYVPTGHGSGAQLFHRPDENVFRTLSQASIELIGLVQTDQALCNALDELSDDWRQEAFTHHDIRWENILTCRAARKRTPSLWIVDWETAGLGDPAWDLGCLFAEYLSHWLSSIPVASAGDVTEYLALASYPLEAAQQAIVSAWTGYSRRLKSNSINHTERLRRVTKYLGSRLVQRALELDQRWATPTVEAVCHLQVGARTLADPDAALTALLGIPYEAYAHD